MLSSGVVKRKSPRRASRRSDGDNPTTTTTSHVGVRKRRRRGSSRPSVVSVVVVLLILGLMIVALLWFILATSSTRKNTVSLSDGRPRVVLLENSPKEAMLRHPSDFLPLFSQRMVEPMITQEQQEALEDSNDYNHRAADVFETLDCQAQYPWQLSVFPNCNSIHEMDMTRIVSPSSHGGAIQPLNHGFWRDVWSRAPTWPDQDPMVLKTMRFEHNVTGRNFDRNRRDALVTERLTKSTWILNGYGFCGNTGVSEYAGGGDISAAIWKKSPLNPDYRIAIDMTTREQLIIGVQAAIGLAELHTFDDKDRPSVAHTDITPGQFVKVNDRFKLNDFNRARFIRVSKNHSLCSFAISKNPGKNRSPEEYTRHALLSEKIDLYSLGNIFYMLLQKQWPFQEENTKEAQRMVKHGYRPSFYEDVWNSTDPYTVALKTAMLRCHQQDPRDRPTASELAYFLKQKLDGLEPGLIASWGEPFASR